MDTAASEYYATALSGFLYSNLFRVDIIYSSFYMIIYMIMSFRYLFCDEFFREQSMFYDIFTGICTHLKFLNL